MLRVYKAFRDAEYMAAMGEERASILKAVIEAIDITYRMRRFCTLGVHIKLDVWDHRCWHERLNDKIERLEDRRVWGNPDITWAPRQAYELDEVDFAPVTEIPDRGIDYHPWRS